MDTTHDPSVVRGTTTTVWGYLDRKFNRNFTRCPWCQLCKTEGTHYKRSLAVVDQQVLQEVLFIENILVIGRRLN